MSKYIMVSGRSVECGGSPDIKALLRQLYEASKYSSPSEMCKIYNELDEEYGYELCTETYENSSGRYSAVFRKKEN